MSKPDGKSARPRAVPTGEQAAREQRLAKALRENLRRRKAPAAAEEPGPADEGDA